MSDKTDDPREDLDLFAFAGLPEHSSVEHGTANPAPPATKPDRNTRKQAPPRIFAEEMANERYLQDVAVAERYSITRQTVWRWAAEEALPEASASVTIVHLLGIGHRINVRANLRILGNER